jgi:holo-[acyl-carrier protein] synthase
MSVLGVGTDLVDVARARRMLERHGARILQRTLTEAEREYVERCADPAPHFAARLAAKEAVYKALQSLPGARALSWRDIEVVRGASGAPAIALHGYGREVASAAAGLLLHVSLTHTETAAAATVVAETG